MRILLAEDNGLNQDLAVRILTKHGHEVTVVDDGALAVERHGAEPAAFDLILMDLNMPRMDGRAATRVIRAAEEGGDARIPILAMTATAGRAEIERALEAGMDGCVEKPIDIKAMLQAIDDAARGVRVQSLRSGRGAPLEWDDALNLLGGDTELLARLAQSFLDAEARLRTAVGSAVEAGDASALEEAAHKLRGSLGNFAALAAYDWAKRLESLGAARDLTGAKEALAHLEMHMSAVRASIEDRLGKG